MDKLKQHKKLKHIIDVYMHKLISDIEDKILDYTYHDRPKRGYSDFELDKIRRMNPTKADNIVSKFVRELNEWEPKTITPLNELIDKINMYKRGNYRRPVSFENLDINEQDKVWIQPRLDKILPEIEEYRSLKYNPDQVMFDINYDHLRILTDINEYKQLFLNTLRYCGEKEYNDRIFVCRSYLIGRYSSDTVNEWTRMVKIIGPNSVHNANRLISSVPDGYEDSPDDYMHYMDSKTTEFRMQEINDKLRMIDTYNIESDELRLLPEMTDYEKKNLEIAEKISHTRPNSDDYEKYSSELTIENYFRVNDLIEFDMKMVDNIQRKLERWEDCKTKVEWWIGLEARTNRDMRDRYLEMSDIDRERMVDRILRDKDNIGEYNWNEEMKKSLYRKIERLKMVNETLSNRFKRDTPVLSHKELMDLYDKKEYLEESIEDIKYQTFEIETWMSQPPTSDPFDSKLLSFRYLEYMRKLKIVKDRIDESKFLINFGYMMALDTEEYRKLYPGLRFNGKILFY